MDITERKAAEQTIEAARAEAHLTKPVDFAALEAAIARVFADRT